MNADRRARMQRTTNLHLAMESEETLRRIADLGGAPDSMQYFYDLARHQHRPEQSGLKKQPVIGTLCVQVPDELIRACGAVPLRLCSGASAHESVGGEYLPAKSCPLVKATLGLLETGGAPEELCGIIVPATCDQKRKLAALLTNRGHRVHLMEMPPVKESEGARWYWQESVKELALVLEKWTGSRLNRRKVREAILERGLAGRQFRRLYDLQKRQPPPLSGRDLLLVANSYFSSEIKPWTDAVSRLCQELKSRPDTAGAGGRKSPRLLLTGSPPIFPNLKLPLLVEEAGASIVVDELCSSNRLLHDQPLLGEGSMAEMLPALADRTLKPCTCPCLADNRDRERRLLSLAADYQVDGVIYQAFSGCLPYELEQRQIGDVLAERNIPMLYVETDYSPEDQGQLSTRTEAFLESLQGRDRFTRSV